ncbi:MAG: hypothetical protein ACRC9T_05440 [Vibrionaceae bacterium]
MKKLLLPLVSLSFFAGAAKPDKPEMSHPYRGIYTQGFEVSSFMPCGSKKDYWLSAKDERLLSRLDARMDKIRDKKGEPYPSVYIEMMAADIGKSEDGFAADYHSTLDMKKLLRYSQTIPRNCKSSS